MNLFAENINWSTPPDRVSISDNEVHIWLASTCQRPEVISLFESLLSQEEYIRAERYLNDADRIRFIIGRGGLKNILSRYLTIKQEEIVFMFNEFGKPLLEKKYNNKNLIFSLSHSGDLIVFGVVKSRDIGIDVEKISDIDSVDSLIQDYFSPQERDAINALPVSARMQAFYKYWTRKEAYIKARGTGLSYPLKKFSVSIVPEESGGIHDDQDDIMHWSIKEFFSTSEYVASVAVKGRGMNYKYYNWGL